MNAATSEFFVVPVQYRCSTLWSFFHLDDEQSTLSYVFHGMQFFYILLHKIYGKESIHPSLGEKNSLNGGIPVVN